ncbi:cyclic nucleotide-binding domain-containing protein [Paraflavitalea speifideaquila]|uniref:Crp/Fnr family transcriptional regulator n=1 Tax=Paraflavitalea speifideaquila TaxID=3076558 RepID=UPI0028E1BFF6|nr:cyclic nucleotide-binding domain-containing protein [Paraflavitalea speifideiaquila]
MPAPRKDCHSLLIKHIGKRVKLGPQQEEQLRDAFTSKEIPARQYLLQHGEVCRYESFVCEGLLRSFHVDGQGNEHTLHFAVEDWWITDLPSFLQQKPATRNIVAMEPVQVLQVSYRRREELLQDPVFERFWRILNERASAAQEERILLILCLRVRKNIRHYWKNILASISGSRRNLSPPISVLRLFSSARSGSNAAGLKNNTRNYYCLPRLSPWAWSKGQLLIY